MLTKIEIFLFLSGYVLLIYFSARLLKKYQEATRLLRAFYNSHRFHTRITSDQFLDATTLLLEVEDDNE